MQLLQEEKPHQATYCFKLKRKDQSKEPRNKKKADSGDANIVQEDSDGSALSINTVNPGSSK
jgi:hypothetical protein